jgi:hypothetical protein
MSIIVIPTPSGTVPAPHETSHEAGGSDAIADLTGLTGLLGTPQTPAPHTQAGTTITYVPSGSITATNVEDAINAVADEPTAAHNTSHESGGSDEIDVAGLTGLLGTAQTPAAHTQAGTTVTYVPSGSITATNIEDALNAVASEPVAAHRVTHENGGADEISVLGLSGLLADGQTPLAHTQAGTTITYTPSGSIAATNVESAINELYSDIAGSYDCIVLTAGGGWASTTSGPSGPDQTEYGTNDIDLQLLTFDKDTDEFAQWTVVMPYSYDSGKLYAVWYWTTASGATANVVWGIQGRAYAGNDAIDQAWGTATLRIDPTTTADIVNMALSNVFTLGGSPGPGRLTQFRVYRDANNPFDTLNADASLLAVYIYYKKNVIGNQVRP